MESLNSFPVGLFHPLQHAGLSRRSTYYRKIACKFFRFSFGFPEELAKKQKHGRLVSRRRFWSPKGRLSMSMTRSGSVIFA